MTIIAGLSMRREPARTSPEYMGREGNYHYEIRAVGKTTNDAKYRKSSEYNPLRPATWMTWVTRRAAGRIHADGKKYVDENGQIVTSPVGTGSSEHGSISMKNGYMATGWRMVNNKWYYLGSDGKMVTGWKQIGGVWYHMDADGAMAK